MKNEVFGNGHSASLAAFPDAKPVVQQRKSLPELGKKDSSVGSNNGNATSKEEQLMARMLGKGGGMFGGGAKKSSKDGEAKKEGGGSGKPKWFKG